MKAAIDANTEREKAEVNLCRLLGEDKAKELIAVMKEYLSLTDNFLDLTKYMECLYHDFCSGESADKYIEALKCEIQFYKEQQK